MKKTVFSERIKYKNGLSATNLFGGLGAHLIIICNAVAAAATVPFSSTSIDAE
jgi:hypothetical protein